MTRFVIVGAGAIGGSLGAGLHNSGTSTVLVARGEHAAVVASRGLRIRTPHGEIHSTPPVVTSPEEVRLTTDDVIVVAVKTPQLSDALATWADRPVYAPSPAEPTTPDHAPADPEEALGTAGELVPVLLMLNGVEAERIAPRFFAEVHSAVVWTPAMFTEPGEIIVRMTPSLAGFIAGPVTAAARRRVDFLAELGVVIRSAGFEFAPVEDVIAHKYGKLLINLENGLDALLGPDADLKDMFRALRTEAKAVYEAAGITYHTQGPRDLGMQDRMTTAEVPGVDGYASSSWQSIKRGTGSIETDYLGGEIVAIAHSVGVEAPMNALVTRLCRQVATGQVEPPEPAELAAWLERLS